MQNRLLNAILTRPAAPAPHGRHAHAAPVPQDRHAPAAPTDGASAGTPPVGVFGLLLLVAAACTLVARVRNRNRQPASLSPNKPPVT